MSKLRMPNGSSRDNEQGTARQRPREQHQAGRCRYPFKLSGSCLQEGKWLVSRYLNTVSRGAFDAHLC
jgi:hypothetical protein